MNNLNTNNQGAAVGQKDDYGDKALAKVQQRFGMKQNKALNEKITDGARRLFEKLSGKKVPAKFSN